MSKLTKRDWMEAEELYKQGWTQKQISIKYKIRPETVSLHMTKAGIKGGENVDVVRQEMEAALYRKIKEFAEKRASRQIDTKEKFHTLVNSVLNFFVKDLKKASDLGHGLDKISGQARSLREAITGLKLAREELYTILDIRDDLDVSEAPDLYVSSLSKEDEDRIRASGAYGEDDEDEQNPLSEDELEELRIMAETMAEPDSDDAETTG